MKKVLCFVFCLVIACTLVCPTFAATEVHSDEIYKGTPTVDGVLDDMYLQSAKLTEEAPSFYSWGGFTDEDLSVTVYFLWDEDYLYYCAVVLDSTPLSAIKGVAEDWMDDSVEHWFLDDNKMFKIHHATDDTFFIENPAWDSGYDLGFTVSADKCLHAAEMNKTGYVVEGALPFPALNVGRVFNYSLQVNDIMYDDASLGSAYGTQAAAYKFECVATVADAGNDDTTVADDTSAAPTDDTTAESPADNDAKVTDPPADTKDNVADKAPQTSDVAVAGIAVLATIALAGAVIVKKVK